LGSLFFSSVYSSTCIMPNRVGYWSWPQCKARVWSSLTQTTVKFHLYAIDAQMLFQRTYQISEPLAANKTNT
jgi:hypothetical protein